MTRWMLLLLLALSACRLGRADMAMAPAKPYVVAPDSRPPSEIDPALHVQLPPTGDGGAAPEKPRTEDSKGMGKMPMPDAAKHPPTAAPTANVSDVVWLRQRVEQLESQLAARAGRRAPEKPPAEDSKGMGSMPMPDAAKQPTTAPTAKPPAATSTTAAPTANVSDVVWLRQRVEQLESQLASRGGR